MICQIKRRLENRLFVKNTKRLPQSLHRKFPVLRQHFLSSDINFTRIFQRIFFLILSPKLSTFRRVEFSIRLKFRRTFENHFHF
jgi:hypothetical protein